MATCQHLKMVDFAQRAQQKASETNLFRMKGSFRSLKNDFFHLNSDLCTNGRARNPFHSHYALLIRSEHATYRLILHTEL